jgi:hypothetical protein
MVELTEEKLGALRTEHGRVKAVTYVDPEDGASWTVVLRAPKGGEYDRFQAMASDERKKSQAQKLYFKDLCVWPEPADLTALLAQWPGIPVACSDPIMQLSGMVLSARAK